MRTLRMCPWAPIPEVRAVVASKLNASRKTGVPRNPVKKSIGETIIRNIPAVIAKIKKKSRLGNRLPDQV
jgi:hypothetical protein